MTLKLSAALTTLVTMTLPLVAQAQHEIGAAICSMQFKAAENAPAPTPVLLYSLKLNGSSKSRFSAVDLADQTTRDQYSGIRRSIMSLTADDYQVGGPQERMETYSFDGKRVTAKLSQGVTPSETIVIGEVADSSQPVKVSWESIGVSSDSIRFAKNAELSCQPLKLNRSAHDVGSYRINDELHVRSELPICDGVCGYSVSDNHENPFIRLKWSVLPNATLDGQQFKIYAEESEYSIFSSKFWARPQGDKKRLCTLKFGEALCQD